MTEIAVTRLERVMLGVGRLPEEEKKIFNDLFVKLKTEEQVCQERGMRMPDFLNKRDEMLRSLRAVAT